MRIGIIGCGVAGQAAAIALSRDGHAATVVERFARAQPLGAGLLLQPSGLAVLERLGLRADAERWGAPVLALDGRTIAGRRVLALDYLPGAHGLGISRSALFDILHGTLERSGAEIVLGFEVNAIENPSAPVLCAQDGRRLGPFDLVLDCAGAHDRLREAWSKPGDAPLYPWGALWAPCPDRSGAFQSALRQVYARAHTMIGILPIGRIPGAAFDGPHVAFFWSLEHARYDDVRKEGLDALKAKVLAAWPAARPILDEIRRFEDLSLATYRDVRTRRWVHGRTVMLGDCAHGTSPQLGQGANLALIDALTLASALRGARDIDLALARYQRLRRAHVAYYRIASRALTPAFQSHSRVIAWLRDALMSRARFFPFGTYMMRTTLTGVRKWPFGVWRMPD